MKQIKQGTIVSLSSEYHSWFERKMPDYTDWTLDVGLDSWRVIRTIKGRYDLRKQSVCVTDVPRWLLIPARE